MSPSKRSRAWASAQHQQHSAAPQPRAHDRAAPHPAAGVLHGEAPAEQEREERVEAALGQSGQPDGEGVDPATDPSPGGGQVGPTPRR